jgi:hypothetical protein
MLTNNAEGYLKKADKRGRKFEARLEKMIQDAVHTSASAGRNSNEDGLRDAVGRIKKRHNYDSARPTYVDGAIELLSHMPSEDSAFVLCPSSSSITNNYKRLFVGYEGILERIENEVKERMKLEERRADEGLVVIAFNSTESDLVVHINRTSAVGGNIEFEHVRPGEYFRVVRAKAGTYNWHRINQEFYDYRRWFELHKLDLSFVVEAGKLNYAGVFMFDVGEGERYSATLEDRLSITLAVLEQRYPELLEQYEIANGLYPDDRFTEFYLREKGLIKSEAASENHE